MKLEEEIHQQTFRNEWQKAMINLLFTHGWMTRRVKAHLKGSGVSMQQYNVLRILNGSHPTPLTTSTISKRMLDKASDASRIVDRMHHKGWVEKSVCKEDKRLVNVLLSPRGRELIAELEQLSGNLDQILGNLSNEEAKELNTLLDRLRG